MNETAAYRENLQPKDLSPQVKLVYDQMHAALRRVLETCMDLDVPEDEGDALLNGLFHDISTIVITIGADLDEVLEDIRVKLLEAKEDERTFVTVKSH